MPVSNSDLLARYLHAVKFWLSKAQQKDILAELEEDLHSQIEDREAALGHALDDGELSAILKRRGAPLRVASGYAAESRLMNPAMFPIYRLVLKIVVLWVLTPIFLLLLLGQIFSRAQPGEAIVVIFVEAARAFFTTIGIVTSVFFVLDRYHAKWQNVDNWDPRKLPRVPAPHETAARCNYFAGFVFGLGAAVCWGYALWQRTRFDIAGGFSVVLNPIWPQVYWLVLVLMLAGAAVDLFSFLNPTSTQLRARLRIALDVVAILATALFFRVDRWIEVVGPRLTADDAAKLSSIVNWTILSCLISAVLINLFDGIVQARRLLQRKPAGRASMLTTG